MTYNPPYYAQLVEGYGFEKSHDLYSYMGDRSHLDRGLEKANLILERIKEMFHVTTRGLDRNRFREDVETFLRIYNTACEHIWGFVPITPKEIEWMSKDMKHLIIPELTSVAEVDGKPIGAVFGMPDYNPRIKKINGRLFPFGFMTLLSKKHDITRVRLISTNVIPEYQRWGIGIVLLLSLLPKGLELGMQQGEFSWVAEDNTMAVAALEKAGTKLDKKFRLYDFAATEHLAKSE
jgi:GNAT superfamily N-acetyltransferase